MLGVGWQPCQLELREPGLRCCQSHFCSKELMHKTTESKKFDCVLVHYFLNGTPLRPILLNLIQRATQTRERSLQIGRTSTVCQPHDTQPHQRQPDHCSLRNQAGLCVKGSSPSARRQGCRLAQTYEEPLFDAGSLCSRHFVCPCRHSDQTTKLEAHIGAQYAEIC